MTENTEKKPNPRLAEVLAKLSREGYGPDGDKPARIMTAAELRQRFARQRQAEAASGKVTSRRQRVPAAPAARAAAPVPAPAPAAARAVVYQRRVPRARAAGGSTSTPSPAPVVLEAAVDGEVAACPGQGECFLLRRRLQGVPGTAGLEQRFLSLLRCPGSPVNRELGGVTGVGEADPADLLFMDIESAGLSCSPLFLIGVMLWCDAGFEVRQYLARNYAEERAVVQQFIRECRRRPLLVTFNGKSFDWPYVCARAAANGIAVDVAPQHLDLLHVSRRCWRGHLPNCKLQTLERQVCGRHRQGDIPGSEIPDAYHDFVRTGNARQVLSILEHNLLDLVTLADLMTRFPDEC